MSLKVNPIVQPEGADFDSSRPPMLAQECVGYDEEGRGQIERFIEVYHAAHSATSLPPCLPVPLLPAIEVFASGRSGHTRLSGAVLRTVCIKWW